jgi:colanic acid/amylovoran biosynthesis glycosyltransferase
VPDKTVVIWRSCLLPASETFVRDQAAALRRWDPRFVGAIRVPSILASEQDAIAYPGRIGGPIGFLGLRTTGRSRRLRSLLTGRDADHAPRPGIIHAHFGGDGWLVSASAVRLNIPLVVTLHGRDVKRQASTAWLRGSRYRRNLRTTFERAAVILAVSDGIRRTAIALGADPSKVRVHPTGVAIPAATTAPKRWDVLFVGRFVEKKGIDDLLEAVALVQPSGRRPTVLLIGDGPLLPAMRARAARLDLHATFLGAQPPDVVRERIAESRMFVSPSKTAANGDAEGVPTTILEAASLGRPVVSTRHSGIPEAVVHGETGFLSNEGDRAAIAGHIATLLADQGLQDTLGDAGRRHIAAHYDIRTQTSRLEDIYDAVAGGGQPTTDNKPTTRTPIASARDH